MKYTAEQYIRYYNPFAGDKDGSYVIISAVSFVKTRVPHHCSWCVYKIDRPEYFEGSARFPSTSLHPPGTMMRKDDGLFDGKWHHMYTCTQCMDEDLDEMLIGSPISGE